MKFRDPDTGRFITRAQWEDLQEAVIDEYEDFEDLEDLDQLGEKEY